MSILIVVAHPDDEVLGCGGTTSAAAASGIRTQACILSAAATARVGRPPVADLEAHARAASDALGFVEPILGGFPNIALNVVPHLELVRFIETAIESSGARTIFTHHPADINDDHLHVSRACQAAARLSHRRSGVPPLSRLFFMEIPSSTDWAFPASAAGFQPDTFVEIGVEGVNRKLSALAHYQGVMRPFPHSRSAEAITALAVVRGAQASVDRAEAFQTAYARIEAARIGA